MPDLDEFGIPIKKVELDEFGIPIKKKDGGVVSQKPTQLQSSSKNILAQRPEELPLGVPKVGAAGIDRLFSAASEAKSKLDQAVSSRDDIYADIIKENRLKQLDTESKSGLSDMVNPALQSARKGIITQIPVTPKEIQSQKDVATTNPNAYRDVLKRAAKKDPEIAKNAYLVDAERRAMEKPEAAEKILQNADKIANGELNYSVGNGVLQKPEGAFVSLYRGLQERNKQVEDYDFLTKTLNDGAIIAQLEDDRTRIDPDEPQPTPSGALAEFGMMAGMEGIAMTKSAAAGLATGLIPGAQAAAPYVAAFAASPEYYQRGYSTALRAAYNEFRQRGDSEYDALQKAREQAETEANLSAAEGFASGFIGAKIGAKPTGFTVGNGFNNAVKNTLVASKNFVTENLVEGGTDAAIAGGLQIAKNISAFDKGLDRGVFDGVQENVVGELAFSFGLGAITKAAKLVINPKDLNTLVTGVARQPKEVVDAKLGEMVVTGQADPEEVVTAGKLIDEARKIDSQIPSTVQDEDTRVVIGEKIKEREALKAELATANEAFHKDIKDKIQNIDNEILNYATTESSKPVQEGAAESNIGEPTGVVQGQREGGTGEGIQGEATLPKADVGDSNLGSKTEVAPGKKLFNEPVPEVAVVEAEFKKSKGINTPEPAPITKLDEEKSKTIADAYDALVDSPNDPEVQSAYQAMADETMEQFDAIDKAGVKVEIWTGKGEPYKNSGEMIADVRDNKHMYIFSTEEGFGDTPITDEQRQQNALLRDSGIKDVNGKPLLINDIFRFVHDYFGHSRLGNSFGAIGEENAWNVHARMYSPLARRAMTTETRGQNSWVNFNKNFRNPDGTMKKKGDEGYVPPAQRPFADQKMALLPEEFSQIEDAYSVKPTVAEELTQELIKDPVAKVQQSLKSAGITVDLIADPAEFDRQVQQLGGQAGMEGVFLADDGKVLLNEQKLKEGTNAGRIIFHEATHPIINIIRNTNPALYNRVVAGINAASDNPAIQQAKAWVESNKNVYDTDVKKEDETLVETIAMVGDGTLDLNTIETGFKQALIEAINTIARALGFNPVLNDTDVAAFKKLAAQIADVLTSGRDIAEVVGADNVKEYGVPVGVPTQPKAPEKYGAKVKHDGGQYKLSFVKPSDIIDIKSLVEDIVSNKQKVWFWTADQLGRGMYFDNVVNGEHYLDAGPSFALDPKNREKGIIWATGKGKKWVEDKIANSDYIFIMSGSPQKSKLFNKRVAEITFNRIKKAVGEEGAWDKFKSEVLSVSKIGKINEILNKYNSFEDLLASPDRKELLIQFDAQKEKKSTPLKGLLDKYGVLMDYNDLRDGFYRENGFDLNDVMLVLKPTGFGGKSEHSTYENDILGEVVGVPDRKVNSYDLMTDEFKKKYTEGMSRTEQSQAVAPYGVGIRDIQASVGGRNIEQRELVKRTNIASDKLKQLFDRDNMPLSIEEAKEIVQEVIDWSNWYDGISEYSESIFGEYTEDFLSLLPLSSQANNSASTVALAIGNSERIYKGENPIGVAEYYGYVSDFLGGKGIKSDKMYNFFKALTGDKDAIAVDMHVWSIIMGKDPNKKQVNPKNQKEFERAKEFVRLLSKELGLAPREVQASLWAANILRTGGKPDSYEEYIERQVNNKGLRERIQGWRDKGYKPFSEVRKRREAEASTSVQASAGNRLAPNGKPSNLTEKQYQQVRTPEFKNWFGDWENDPANASKVVDENGEPLVVYHGTKNKFDEFDPSKMSWEARLSQQGPGFYFTNNKKAASGYGKPLNTYVSIKNPLEIKDLSQNITKEQAIELFSNGDYDWFYSDYLPFITKQTGSREELLDKYISDNLGRGFDKFVLKNIKRAYTQEAGYGNLLNSMKDVLGVDGVIEKPTKTDAVYVALSPNQIKSATANVGTFSTEDARIQFSAGNREIINGFYSPIQKRVNEFKQPKASVQKWKEIVGTKTDEAVFSGLADWLGGMKPDRQLTKEEVNNFMSDNRIEINEVEKQDNKVDFPSDKLKELNSLIREEGDLGFFTTIGALASIKDNPNFAEDLDIQSDRLIELGNEYREARSAETKYSTYQLPGGENYKEILITLPGKDKFKSSHFKETNIITHLRMNTRTDVDGNKVLFLEEVQSDWGQKGKKEGFKVEDQALQDKYNEVSKKANEADDKLMKAMREYRQTNPNSSINSAISAGDKNIEKLYNEYQNLENERVNMLPAVRKVNQGVQPAPYVTNTNAWVKLGLKVALKEAIRQGADRISWTTGQQQNERYDLRKQVDEITYSKLDGGNYRIVTYKDGNALERKDVPESGLEAALGKDVADRIISGVGDVNKNTGVTSLSGINLSVGGKGMKDFYGDAQNVGIVGKVAKALVKELTGKEGEIVAAPIKTSISPKALYDKTYITDQPAIDITPELVQAVEGGLPQFSAGNRPENNQNFKLAAFVMRKKAEGATDGEIAIGIASVTGMKPEDIKTIIDNPEQFIRDSFPSMSKLQQDNLIQKAKIQDIYRGRQFGKPIDKPFIGLEVPQEMVDDYLDKTGRADKTVKDWAKDFKRKWLDPAKGLPDWTLAIKDFATGAKNIEVARAANTIQRLKDTAKQIGFKDWDAFSEALVMAKDVQRFIPDETGVAPFDVYRAAANRTFATPDDKLPALVPDAIKKLPDEIIPFVYAMRGQIDNLTRDLIGSGYVTPEQAVTLEKNLGAYTNRAYKIFSERGYVPEKKVYNAAVKFLAQQKMPAIANDNVGVLTDKQIVEKAMEEAKKDVEIYLSKKKNPYFGSKSDRRDTGILQERKDIPEPIRNLMGQYTDPGTVFIMTVAKQAALKSASQYLNKLRTMGMGTLFFEREDPSRPVAEYTVEIAPKGSESMNPLGGLYTTKEIAEALDMVDPTYNDLTETWMKLVGMVRWGKTVGSVATQFKNFESNGGFAVLNGYMLSGENTQAFKAAAKYVKGQYSKGEIDAITDKVIRLNLVGQSVGMRELKEMLGSGDVHDIAVDIALNPEGKWGKRVAKRVDVLGAANKLYRLGDDFWKVYAYMVEREQISDARFNGAKYDSLSKQQQEQVDIESSERVKNTWPTYDRVVEGAKFVSKRAPVFGNFISFRAESLRVLANSIKLAKQDLSDPQMRHLGVRRMAGITAYIGLRSAITIGLAKMAGFAAAGIAGAIFGDDEEERNKRAIKEALPTFMRTGDLAVVQGDKPHQYTVVDMSSLDPYGVVPNSLNAFTEGREGIFGRTMEPGVLAAGTELFSGFLEPEMTFQTMWSVINNKDPKTGEQLVMETDTDLQATAKVAAKIWDQLEPSTVSMIQRLYERDNKEAELLALGGARPYDVDLHKSFGFVLSRFGKDIDAINKEYNSIKYNDKMTEQEKEAAEKVAEDKKAFAISKVSQIYRDFINIGADPKVLDELINQKSAVKVTGYDKNTKKSIKTGKISKEKLFK